MTMARDRRTDRPGRRARVAAALALLFAGCAADSRTTRSGCAPDAQAGPAWWQHSTIGHDLRAAPRGQTIPATGLGVDLVSASVD
ncbi:MAG TPA: hypothetical protein VGZ22_19100 [Isosphaeraceae bacterium]|nr:hypothetical protein [Isosphaeraceae bacterium]